jgi:hypothetical protein
MIHAPELGSTLCFGSRKESVVSDNNNRSALFTRDHSAFAGIDSDVIWPDYDPLISMLGDIPMDRRSPLDFGAHR